MHTLNSNALLEDLLFRCYHIYNINLTKGMKDGKQIGTIKPNSYF